MKVVKLAFAATLFAKSNELEARYKSFITKIASPYLKLNVSMVLGFAFRWTNALPIHGGLLFIFVAPS